MVKRKADASTVGGSGRGKAAVKPPPPVRPAESNNDDADDSDFCEVVEGPSEENRTAPPNCTTTHNNNVARAPLQAQAMSSRVAAPPSHVASGRGRLGFPGAMAHQGSQNGAGSQGAMLSMLAAAGLSNPPYHRNLHPPHSNNHLDGFGFPMGMGMSMGQLPQMQMQHMAGFAFGGAPGMYVPSRGFQGGGYSGMAGFLSPSSPALPPPAEQSSASQTQAFQRVFEGAGAQEVKEEPDNTSLCPTQMEAPLVAVLRAQGVPSDDAVQSLRANGHNVGAALKHALMTLTDRENSRNEDMARYASEQEKEKAAAAQRQEDMSLTVVGDIVPRFQESLLLDEKHGCAVFRRAIHEMCSGQEDCPPALYALRERAVKLLFLERDAFKWYRDVKPQVRGYFRQLAERLEQFVPHGNDADSGEEAGAAETSTGAGNDADSGEEAGAAETSTGAGNNADSGEEAGAAETSTGAENSASRAQKRKAKPGKGSGSAGDHSNKLIVESETRQLTARVEAEIKKLQIVLFSKPSTSGGVPDAFIACNEHSATLEVDGVEELRHESAAESRCSRGGQDIVVINDDDDG